MSTIGKFVLSALLVLASAAPVAAQYQSPRQPGGTFSVPLLAPDGSASAPSYSFASDSDTGIYVQPGNQGVGLFAASGGTNSGWYGSGLVLSSSGLVSWVSGAIGATAVDVSLSRGAANRLDLATGDSFHIVSGGLGVGVVETTSGVVTLPAAGQYNWTGRSKLTSSGDGLFNVISSGGTIGMQVNVGTAAPTISSGGGTSPSIVAGARNSAGSVNIGTGGTASQIVIAFASPAWTNAPYCTAWVETTTAGNVRAHGVTTTTTTMTIQAASAWAASSIVAWKCEGRI